MTNFIWTAKDRSGKTVVREVMANTIEESKTILVSEGCTNLELYQDEVMAAATAGMTDNVTVMGEAVNVTAEQRLAQRNKPPLTVWKAIYQGIGQSWGFSAFILILCIFLANGGYTLSAILAGCALLAWLAFIIGVSFPVIYYGKLQRAADWYRWSEVFDLLAKLEVNNKISFNKIPRAELARQRAIALAGTGRISQAVSEYQQYENQPGCPSWLHKAFLVGIYATAKQYDKALECALKSIEEKPTPVMYVDLANQWARYHRNAARAREALNEAEKATLPEVSKPFHIRCRGIVAYLEGDYTIARRELETSIELMEQTRNEPGRDGNMRVAKAYLCCVIAKQGDLVAARKLFGQAIEYLVATNEAELIEECNRALRAS